MPCTFSRSLPICLTRDSHETERDRRNERRPSRNHQGQALDAGRRTMPAAPLVHASTVRSRLSAFAFRIWWPHAACDRARLQTGGEGTAEEPGPSLRAMSSEIPMRTGIGETLLAHHQTRKSPSEHLSFALVDPIWRSSNNVARRSPSTRVRPCPEPLVSPRATHRMQETLEPPA